MTIKGELDKRANWKWLFIELGVWAALLQLVLSFTAAAILPSVMLLFGMLTAYYDVYLSRIYKKES